MKDPVKDKLKRFGLFTRFGEEKFFPTIGEAVRRTYLTRHQVEWKDWGRSPERGAAQRRTDCRSNPASTEATVVTIPGSMKL